MIRLLKTLRNRTPLGWLQLKHDKARLFTAIAGVTFADILIFMQFGFKDALYKTNTQYPRNLKADIVLISIQAQDWNKLFTFPRRRLYQAMDVPGVESADALYVGSVEWRNPQTREKKSMLIIGQTPEIPAFSIPEINRQLDIIKMPDTVLFDKASRGNYRDIIAQVEQKKPVTTEIARRTITIGGLFKLGASFAYDGAIITNQQNFLRLMPKREAGTVNLGLIYLQAGSDATQIKADLNAYLPQDVRALTNQEYVDFEINYIQTNTSIGFVFGLGSIMGLVVGIVIVYQVLSTDVNDHLAEYATFKAMGYRNIYFLTVVFEQAIILAVIGFIPSLAIAVGMYRLTAIATALPISMPLGRVIWVLILTIIMCSISGAIATRKLQSADPADIF